MLVLLIKATEHSKKGLSISRIVRYIRQRIKELVMDDQGCMHGGIIEKQGSHREAV
jgi:hypothetical protein